MPFGIVGIVYASKVEYLYQNGLYDQAQKASADAGKWTKISFWLGLIVIVLYFIAIMFSGASIFFLQGF